MGKDIVVYGMQLVRIYILSTLRSQQRRLREAKPGEGRWEGNGGRKGSGGSSYFYKEVRSWCGELGGLEMERDLATLTFRIGRKLCTWSRSITRTYNESRNP